jgi:hypothetical protein
MSFVCIIIFFLQANVLFKKDYIYIFFIFLFFLVLYIRHFHFWRVVFPDVPVSETSRHFLVSCNLGIHIAYETDKLNQAGEL